jgi:hypothetical protein
VTQKAVLVGHTRVDVTAFSRIADPALGTKVTTEIDKKNITQEILKAVSLVTLGHSTEAMVSEIGELRHLHLLFIAVVDYEDLPYVYNCGAINVTTVDTVRRSLALLLISGSIYDIRQFVITATNKDETRELGTEMFNQLSSNGLRGIFKEYKIQSSRDTGVIISEQ